MVFLSSQIKLKNLPVGKEEIYKYDWFLFSIMIKTKDIKYDNELFHIHNRMIWYPFVHKEPLYNYLMTDKYYFNSDLYKIMQNTAEIVCMRKITLHNKETTFIPEENRIYRERDIIDMFDYFKSNNYRNNPICEYTMPITHNTEIIVR